MIRTRAGCHTDRGCKGGQVAYSLASQLGSNRGSHHAVFAECRRAITECCGRRAEEEGGVPSRLIKTDRLEAGKEGTPMTNVRTLPVGESNEEFTVALDELAREGARRMIAAALRAEADAYVERFAAEVDEYGHRLVVRNGRARERRVTVGRHDPDQGAARE